MTTRPQNRTWPRGLSSWLAPTLLSFMATQAPAAPRPAEGGAADIHVDAAWIVPYPDSLIAYATITNATDKYVAIRGAESAACGSITMNVMQGPHRAYPTKSIQIKPHSTTDFKASHVHFQLHHLKPGVEKQRQVSLTLRFNDGSTLAVPFEIHERDLKPDAPPAAASAN